jgi:hypothetical protein
VGVSVVVLKVEIIIEKDIDFIVRYYGRI